MDKVTGRVSGNPADAPQVQDLLYTIKNVANAGGNFRDHAEALTIADVRKLIQWSFEQCPKEYVDEAVANPLSTNLTSVQLLSKHLQMRAYISSAYTLWTR